MNLKKLWFTIEKLLQTTKGNKMKISEEGKALIKRFEGCKLEAYLCPANKWTIAYGRIKDVKEGDTCTQEQAEKWLDEELEEYEGYVENAVKLPLSQCQFDALVAWTYNLGPTNLSSSTMLKCLNKAEFDRVPSEIKRWNKAGGEVLDGLIRRREAEALLFQGKDWHEV